ncbi:hypothetical protein J6P59_01750 [bacterium]|nr:hypothetical protein [bacterium]
MTAENIKKCESIINIIIKTIFEDNPKMTFIEQTKFIKQKLIKTLEVLDSIKDVDINDPQLEDLIKNSVVIKENKPIVFQSKGYKP